ncbi:MAG: hypothetical protein WA584_17355 [Pyrinomonadaceae bacterium]
MINPNESWHVDVNGEVYETNFQGLVNWIDEGSLLRVDKVRRGNLRWLEAGKIPLLYGFFNAKDMGQPMPAIQFSTTEGEVQAGFATQPTEFPDNIPEAFTPTQNFSPQQTDFSPPNNFTINESLPSTENFIPPPPNPAFNQPQFAPQMPAANVCMIHADAEASYLCDTCMNVFCKACPKGYGGNVKICPMCGSMCSLIKQVQQNQVQDYQFRADMNEGFGVADFGRAFAYPFKFKASLIFGAILFMLFNLGQSASGMGSFMMLAAVIICFMLSNMLTFGIMANTVENFSQGKIGGNFMPSFDEFSLWDDMVHPFFLSLGTYIVSFGLTIAIIGGGAWYMWKTISTTLQKDQTNIVSQMESMQDDPSLRDKNIKREDVWMRDNDRARQADLENMRKQMETDKLKTLAASTGGQDIPAQKVVETLLKTAKVLVIPLIISLLWGFFYYPAACAVASYTRSFTATLNPMVGLDTIKHLGFDYFKVLGMMVLLTIITGSIGFILKMVFKPFELPGMGNLPATAVGSWFTFYFSIVFAVILGYLLYKNTEKLNMFRR